jgi:hypothetical protein
MTVGTAPKECGHVLDTIGDLVAAFLVAFEGASL